MAGNLSDWLKNELRKHVFRTGNATAIAELWVALYTAAPSDAGGGTEVTGAGYARVHVGPSDATWSAHATAGRTQNVALVQFGAPTANWGIITHVGLFDAVAGNLLTWNALVAPKTVNNGDAAPSFDATALDFQWD